jgi:hypothetical protein
MVPPARSSVKFSDPIRGEQVVPVGSSFHARPYDRHELTLAGQGRSPVRSAATDAWIDDGLWWGDVWVGGRSARSRRRACAVGAFIIPWLARAPAPVSARDT